MHAKGLENLTQGVAKVGLTRTVENRNSAQFTATTRNGVNRREHIRSSCDRGFGLRRRVHSVWMNNKGF